MTASITDETVEASSVIEPNGSKTFVYVGDFVPNQVFVKNLGSTEGRFKLTSEPAGWTYYGRVMGDAQASLTVNFPSGKMTCINKGLAPISFFGNGIRAA